LDEILDGVVGDRVSGDGHVDACDPAHCRADRTQGSVPSAGVFVRVEESCSLTLRQSSYAPPRGYPFPVVQRGVAADHQTATRFGSRRALRSGSG
jgi:hypothetical protein